MSDWDGLLATALVGTGRRAPRDDVLAGVVEPGALPVEGPEAEVLASAAVLAVYRRAGWVPPTWQGERPAPAGPDTRPECSETAAQLLELLLERGVRMDGGNAALTEHWLRACVAAGRRPPARLLVSLLQTATVETSLREAARDAAGPRGAWLAVRNRRWSWAAAVDVNGTEGDVGERFATAARAERLALLTALRRTDPAGARELVEGTWPSEQAASRAALLDALGTGLSDADEDFLESALADRAATVRAAAAALLDRLPRSRRARRMAARVEALTRPDGGIALPAEPDAGARADGITDQREPGHGLRASWLIQLVGAAPLPPVRDPRGEPGELVAGWTRAALRQRHHDWLATLAEATPTAELLGALPPERAAAIVAVQPSVDARFAGLLAACPGPWPATFSADVVARLRGVRTDRLLTLAYPALAERLHPAALPDVDDWLEATAREQRARRRMLRGLAHALTIRRTIEQEFS
ncbi:DUF5691 domain-containing protein [Prauserella cavernicola]|uniref:Uncharacterized protein n=1 Tax=Prauserella cavernicola TaxID=2800127 RepID=A0A934QNV5_9PSEU|nr:DUF5691 domain-containing protein [Prauserella cavernicola]MBK1783303.1 hypothetical protein [Prauserella cavernicola]